MILRFISGVKSVLLYKIVNYRFIVALFSARYVEFLLLEQRYYVLVLPKKWDKFS